MKKFRMLAVLGALVLVTALAVPAALGYFTTYVRVPGSRELVLKDSSRMKEENIGGNKHVVITADEGSDPIFVRVIAYAPTDIEDELVYEGEGWSKGEGGYWYYENAISDGETAELDISLPEREIDKDRFNVVVMYEYTPAKADGAGGMTADWDAKLIIDESTGKGGEGA